MDHIFADKLLALLANPDEGEERQMFSRPPPEKCDLCSGSLSEETYFVDGAVKDSKGWANMCPKCFFEKGDSIEWGKGQLYSRDEDGRWLMVAGFPPADDECGTECSFCGREHRKDEMVEFKDGEWACNNCAHEAGDIMGGWMGEQDEDEDDS